MFHDLSSALQGEAAAFSSIWPVGPVDPTPERILPMNDGDESTKQQTGIDQILSGMDSMLQLGENMESYIPDDYTAGEPVSSHHLGNTIVSGFESVGDSVMDFTEDAWNSTEDFFSSAWDSTTSFTENTFDSVGDFFQGMPNFVETEFDKVVDTVTPSDFVSNLKEKGKSIEHVAKDVGEVLLVGLGLGAFLLYYNKDTIVEYGGKAYNEAKKAAPLFLA
jgi:hypothetical protein